MRIIVTRFSEPFAEVTVDGDKVTYSGRGQLFVEDYVQQRVQRFDETEAEIARRLPSSMMGHTRARVESQDSNTEDSKAEKSRTEKS